MSSKSLFFPVNPSSPPPHSRKFLRACVRSKWLTENLLQIGDEAQALLECSQITEALQFEVDYQQTKQRERIWSDHVTHVFDWCRALQFGRCLSLRRAVLDSLEPAVEGRALRALGDPLVHVLVDRHWDSEVLTRRIIFI
jgi:hypothetical protein